MTNNFEDITASNVGSTAGKVFLAAVSGGADSMAMLAAAAALRRRLGFSLHCLHVDHGIRPPAETRGDAAAVESLCASLNVPFNVVSLPYGKVVKTAKEKNIGIEAAARFFRHKAWNSEARRLGVDRILVGHTKDDLLETALMRVLRGAGPAGLAAMQVERGRILRPILTLTREDVLEYLREKGISFRTDSTNDDINYLRNRIRHKLIPCLDEFFPYWRKTVFDMTATQSLTAEFLSGEAEKKIVWEEEGGGLYTSKDGFFDQPLVIREEALFQAVDRLGLSRGKDEFEPDFIKTKEKSTVPRRKAIRIFAENGKGIDAGPIRIETRGKNIVVKTEKKTYYDEGFSLTITEPGVYNVKGLQIHCFADGEIPIIMKEKVLNGNAMLLESGSPPLAFTNSRQNATTGLDKTKHLGYKNNIAVKDAKGPLAYIFFNDNNKKDMIILLCREEKGGEEKRLSCVIVSRVN